MLLGGCASSGSRSAVIRLANSAVPSDVGLYSFDIYLMQESVAKVMLVLQNASAGHCASTGDCVVGVLRHMYHAGHWGTFGSLWWSIYAAVLIGLAKAWYKCVHKPTATAAPPTTRPYRRCLCPHTLRYSHPLLLSPGVWRRRGWGGYASSLRRRHGVRRRSSCESSSISFIFREQGLNIGICSVPLAPRRNLHSDLAPFRFLPH